VEEEEVRDLKEERRGRERLRLRLELEGWEEVNLVEERVGNWMRGLCFRIREEEEEEVGVRRLS